MADEKGIKETQEMFDAVFAYVIAVMEAGKDGYDITDAVKVAANPELLAKGKIAFEGIKEVSSEMKNLSPIEGKILLSQIAEGIGKILLAAGLEPDSKARKIIKQLPRVIALAEHNYTEGQAIYQDLNAA